MRVRREPDPRAQSSGFGPKLRAFFVEAVERYERGVDVELPRNARQLSKWLTSKGESASDGAVRNWEKGWTLPGANYIALLERLFGVPWLYLDDPQTPPVSDDVREIFQLAQSEQSARQLEAALRKKIAEARQRRPRA